MKDQENTPKADEKLIEELAELEHNQWMRWSKNIAETENISEEKINDWKKDWIPYTELSEDTKEQDRAWARRSIATVRKYDTE